jgi:RNA polymerase sigma factor (sigma-70 family)
MDTVEDLTQYLREIAQHPLLTAEDELELGRRLAKGRWAARQLAANRAGDEAQRQRIAQMVDLGTRARQQMIEANLRLVVSIAKRYRGHGLSLADLIQEGNIGLHTGVDKYDWRKGFRLSTYVYWWIRQAITRAVANDGRAIRLPVHVGERLREAAHAEQRLETELGRTPTLVEIGGRVGIEPDRLEALRRAAEAPASLDAPIDVQTRMTRGDTIADDAAGPEQQVVSISDDLETPVAAALETLQPREREVLRLRYGLGCSKPWSLAQVGARLGVTRERARQLEGQALRKLRGDAQLRRALVELTSA